ncbi:hypothetical protein CONLIGDRAFT_657852 [Coniochaeta ligniaria NRRL 30616]|uniref:Osmotin, thaumatin-like protein n=1 Tax=Coniochaeta ligniaria NRRL 30616 TaxID=1408157 RepID=A0A1J7IQE9_9PEZI|nr:hypothetical protein CONLIGDRAFT_657852 [Coniochaeta ligniaria NRRL 30616]
MSPKCMNLARILIGLTLGLPTAFSRPTQAASPIPTAQIFTPGTIAASDVVPGPPLVTITISNHHITDISTMHKADPTAAQEIGGIAAPGIMARGATAEFAVPTGWTGMVAVVEDSGTRAIVGDESIIEANYVVPDGYTVAVADVDVSYVAGFSLPIVCACDGTGLVTGCNKYLWDIGICPLNNGVGSCINPLRDDETATQAQDFFKPCQGSAYTFVEDHGGNSFGVCQSGHIGCCVGSDCPTRP